MKAVAVLGRIALGFAPQVFNADQALHLQPRIRRCLLQRWGSCHVPVAVAADAMLDCRLQAHAQVQQVPNIRARPAPLFSYDITCLRRYGVRSCLLPTPCRSTTSLRFARRLRFSESRFACSNLQVI